MKKELTNEVLEAMAGCDEGCPMCEARDVCLGNRLKQFNILATALLEERAKPKAWDEAPDDAIQAQITWFTENGGFTGIKTYTRELPKTRARQIAEQEGHGLAEKYGWNAAAKELVTNRIESALNKYAEELQQTQQHESNSSSVKHGRVVR